MDDNARRIEDMSKMLTVSQDQAKKFVVTSGRFDFRSDLPATDTSYRGQPGTRRNIDRPDNLGYERCHLILFANKAAPV